MFCAALEQAEQLFSAANAVSDAASPILLFYGVSQAGRAIAAASTEAGNNEYRLAGHGIKVSNLEGPELHELVVADEGRGSFTQLASILRSGTLPGGATLGAIWVSLPSLAGMALGDTPYMPPLRFAPLRVMGLNGSRQEIVGWVHGLPSSLLSTGDRGAAVREFLSRYPALADSGESQLVPEILVQDERQAGAQKSLRSWPWAAEISAPERFLREFGERRTLAYLGDEDRWALPSLGGADLPLHPLLAWWALLFTLSMLARYEPAKWARHLDVDRQQTAVSLETTLNLAQDICPQLILHAIQAVSEPVSHPAS